MTDEAYAWYVASASDLKNEVIDIPPRVGQLAGTPARGLSITHLPSGVTVSIDGSYSRSDIKNHAKVIEIMHAAVTLCGL